MFHANASTTPTATGPISGHEPRSAPAAEESAQTSPSTHKIAPWHG